MARSTPITASTTVIKHKDDTIIGTWNFTRWLGDTDTIASVTSTTEETTSDLTIGDPSVNAAEITVDGFTIAANKAVQTTIAGGNDGTLYHVKAKIVTTLGKTLNFRGPIQVSNV